MATDKPNLSVYLPLNLLEQLEEFKIERGILSSSAAIVAILEDYFEATGLEKRGKTLNRLEALEGKVASLTQQVNELNQAIAPSTPRLLPRTAFTGASDLTDGADANESRITTEAIANLEDIPIDDDDIEDEPDEILYDFLEPGTYP